MTRTPRAPRILRLPRSASPMTSVSKTPSAPSQVVTPRWSSPPFLSTTPVLVMKTSSSGPDT